MVPTSVGPCTSSARVEWARRCSSATSPACSHQSPRAADDNPFSEEVVVARIDFDYLNLDYPRLNPGLLLDAFAQELRATGDSRANSLFDEASALFDKAHHEL